MTDDIARLLQAYDDQLRRDAEVVGALSFTKDGPLVRGVFGWGGFTTYRSLGGVDDLDELIERTIAHYRDETEVARFEWKTRGHDQPADLGQRLVAQGFQAEELETVMVGPVEHLVQDVELPPGVRIRQAGVAGDFTDDVTRAHHLQNAGFGGGDATAVETIDRLERSRGNATMWLAEDGDEVISAGRLEIVPGTDFAGLWGGVTHAARRGQGIYRALTAARAAHAQQAGVKFMQSDCSPMSQPILERSGLTAVTTTTPYIWTRV